MKGAERLRGDGVMLFLGGSWSLRLQSVAGRERSWTVFWLYLLLCALFDHCYGTCSSCFVFPSILLGTGSVFSGMLACIQ